jgi:hypothetical protein
VNRRGNHEITFRDGNGNNTFHGGTIHGC